jgi:chemotaxis protein CheX
MASLQAIDPTVFDLAIDRAVQAVFRTMIGKPARTMPADLDPAEPTVVLGEINAAGTVGVVGDLNGLIYLYFPLPFAEHCAVRLLGSNPKHNQAGARELVDSVVGELTNMTAGAFKNQLAEIGFPCRLTLPSVLRGDTFTLNPPKSATRRLSRFDLGGHMLRADIILEGGV